jgi:hypothetical protein
MDASSFSNNVVAGIVASFLTVSILELLRRLRLRRRYRLMAGRYLHYSVDGARLLDGVTELTYVGGTLLQSRGVGGIGPWEGRIVMNTELSGYGTGTYQYLDRVDCGVLEVQLNQRDGSIYVRGVNTSHGSDRVFAYLWKPERPSTISRVATQEQEAEQSVGGTSEVA